MSLSQGLHQKLLQKLSPQQIQLMKLLQVPTAILEETHQGRTGRKSGTGKQEKMKALPDADKIDEFEAPEDDYEAEIIGR